jgi:single-strand DNA-binding protein
MLNSVILIGRLTKDPELRYTPNGIAVSTFNLAVNRNFTNKQGQKEADFINIVAWRNTAELVAKYLTKGSMIAVEGRIQTRNYDNNEGKRVYVTEVVADNVRFLETRKDGSYASETSFAASDNRPADKDDPFAGGGGPIDISDDDLPF